MFFMGVVAVRILRLDVVILWGKFVMLGLCSGLVFVSFWWGLLFVEFYSNFY